MVLFLSPNISAFDNRNVHFMYIQKNIIYLDVDGNHLGIHDLVRTSHVNIAAKFDFIFERSSLRMILLTNSSPLKRITSSGFIFAFISSNKQPSLMFIYTIN